MDQKKMHMRMLPALSRTVLCALLMLAVSLSVYAKEDKATPTEFGVYIKTEKDLVRLLPNIVFEEQGVLYIESNNPARFLLKDVEYFVVYGKYDLSVLTINPMVFFQTSSLGKTRFMFGQAIELNVQKRGTNLVTVKPKGLFGRGYFSLWIEDSAWDFLIE
jgi:hypothetical protein